MRKNKKIAIAGIILIIGLLTITGYIIYTLSKSISLLTEETKPLQTELEENQQVLDNLATQLTNIRNDIIQTSENLNNTIDELALRQSATRYIVYDPLYWEVRNFLNNDSTDTKPYNETTFDCSNYAQEVNNNAEKEGIRCAYVTVNFSDSNESHALIAFESTDRGLNFFEPQTDEKVNLEIGKNYWADCVVPNGNNYYAREPGYTIESFTVYW
jgi:hypothetical protein